MIAQDLSLPKSITSKQQQLNIRMLRFAQRTFADLLSLGNGLLKLETAYCKKEGSRKGRKAFSTWLSEGFEGSQYLAKSCMKLANWYRELPENLRTELKSANSMQTFSQWSLSALRLLPKMGEDLLKNFSRAGYKTASFVRKALGIAPKPKQPRVTLQDIASSYERMQTLVRQLDQAKGLQKDALQVEVEQASKEFASLSKKMGFGLADAKEAIVSMPRYSQKDLQQALQKERQQLFTVEDVSKRIESAVAEQTREILERLKVAERKQNEYLAQCQEWMEVQRNREKEIADLRMANRNLMDKLNVLEAQKVVPFSTRNIPASSIGESLLRDTQFAAESIGYEVRNTLTKPFGAEIYDQGNRHIATLEYFENSKQLYIQVRGKKREEIDSISKGFSILAGGNFKQKSFF